MNSFYVKMKRQETLKIFLCYFAGQTRIEQFPMDLQVTEGKDAKFTCSGTTDPEEVQNLRTIWLKDERPIMTNDQRMTLNIQDSSLTISGTISRDSGIYTCIIANGLDNATASAVLRVRGRFRANLI